MKNIVIYYLYSNKNAGDMAICLGLLDLLKNYDDISITMVSRYTKNDVEYINSKKLIEKYHPTVNVVPGYIPFDRSSNKIKKLFSYIYGGIISVFPFLNRRIKQDLKDADVVFLNGGNFMRCNSFADASRLRAFFIPLKIAKKQKKPIICLPQSTAKTEKNKYFKQLKKYFNIFDAVFARENISYEYLLENKIVEKEKLTLACDLAFFSKKSILDKKYKKDAQYNSYVGFNMRLTGIGDIGQLSTEQIAHIFNFYKTLVINNKNVHFTLICQTKKDYESMKNLYDELITMNIKNIAFVENYDAYELKGIFEQLDLLISMRLHASILAISSGTNVVGFTFEEWGFKNAGILKQFSMTNYSTGDDILANIDFKELPKNKSDVIYKQISSLETIILEKLKPFLSI